ncbi:MAG: ribonucleotide reductase subunit alpha [Betaproteobacteria bacterium HGW-Betaproteobacteria-18]|nr:MAG: ribonucleotide reductase subunit alpha [Betaproteobacteria bacterium HGW-Betaproteobacteria-18]
MTISCLDDLLLAACEQPQAQRLLLVFAASELPDDATPEQRAGFEQGAGGALVPTMCVDKTPDEIGNFERLKQEADQFDAPWRILFASSLSGSGDQPPASDAAEPALQGMVEAIKLGGFANMIAFDTSGIAITLE